MDFIIFAINFLFSAYYLLLALRAVLPWIPHNRSNPWLGFVYRMTDPLLNPIRLGLPPLRIGIDVSPFVAIFFIWLIHRIIIYLLGG